MSLYAIGDIHGCITALETLITAVNLTSEDQLAFLGDYVNRGPDSKSVIDFLLHLSNRHRCIFLRGNHEIMILEARENESSASSWRLCGGRETLASYGFRGEGNWWEFIPAAHWHFFESTRRYFETDRNIFVHAFADHETDMDDQPDWILFWERFDGIRPHKSGKRIICGHTPDRDGQIDDRGYAICIDTACVLGGWLTCLNVDTGEYWQANQKAQIQTGHCENWK